MLPYHALLLIACMAAAIVAQGGYYLPGRILSATLVAVALVLALRRDPLSVNDLAPVLPIATGLAAWALLRSSIAGEPFSAAPMVASIFCVLAAFLAARRANSAQRALFASTIVGIGVLVAMSGWLAVVLRISAWTTVADGLVRAAATLTYPNAVAAVLAALALLSLSRPPTGAQAGATCLLLVGLGATLSRAGLLAFAAGLVLLVVLTGIRATARNLAAPAIGAAVALAALAPSFRLASPARPMLAIGGLVAGLLVVAALNRLPVKAIAVLAGLTTATAVAGVLAASATLLPGRVTLSSPDRGGIAGAALDTVSNSPVTGVGPGNSWFVWTPADGITRVGRYVHNEYLQVLVELGVIGLALLLGLIVAVAVYLWHGRPSGDRALWAGSLAALTALLVHSGFDFLWHIPAILLIAGSLIGLSSPLNEKGSE